MRQIPILLLFLFNCSKINLAYKTKPLDLKSIYNAIEHNNVETVSKLLSEVQANEKGSFLKKPALHKAIKVKDTNLEIITALIKFGFNVNALDKQGYAPIHIAVLTKKPKIVSFLLEYGADVNILSLHNTTPLHQATIYTGNIEIIAILLEHNANTDGLKVDINAVDEYGNTPLHYAALNMDYEAIKLLLEHNANVNVFNSGQITPLYWAISSKKEETEEIKSAKVKAVRVLLEHGADIYAPNTKKEIRAIDMNTHSLAIDTLIEQKRAEISNRKLFQLAKVICGTGIACMAWLYMNN